MLIFDDTMRENLRDRLRGWCYYGIKCFYIFALIIFVIICFAWMNCANQDHCPDPNYQYMYRIQRNPEVYVCCKYDYYPDRSNQCQNVSTHQCDAYNTLMWAFITTLLIITTPILFIWLCRYLLAKCSKSQTTQELQLQRELLRQELLRQELL
jgi:hypothetical protein